ncbi:MAG TPA: radical SAM protein, partial [Thermoanaerobaculia bacterium]|nr:radical SAM protein [Thermoanaerobaculia bacterium]
MTDVLLAHAFFLAHDAKQQEKMRPYPPLGTLFAAASLRARGHRVALFDATFAAEADFAAALDRHRPRRVVLYEDSFHFLSKMCLLHAREAACRMAGLARRHGATVLAAGADVTDHPRPFLDAGVDWCLLGEADHSLVEALAALDGGGDPRAVPGVAWADAAAEGGVATAPARLPERDPDVFGAPAWDLVEAAPYRRAWSARHGRFSLNMVTTRGCPYRCNWCAKPIWGRRYAMRSPAAVAEEMARLRELHAPDHLWFADDIFGLKPSWVADFGREVEERGARLPFTIQSRVDLMTPAAVAGLARAGCEEVWLGVESGSQRILDAMEKGIEVDEVPAARRRLAGAGIRASFFLQLGYPGETWEDVAATVELVRRTLPDDVGVSVSYPLPGTRFHAMVAAELGARDHWLESNDLAMMFRGTYTTAFYRRLHDFLHRDLAAR